MGKPDDDENGDEGKWKRKKFKFPCNEIQLSVKFCKERILISIRRNKSNCHVQIVMKSARVNLVWLEVGTGERIDQKEIENLIKIKARHLRHLIVTDSAL